MPIPPDALDLLAYITTQKPSSIIELQKKTKWSSTSLNQALQYLTQNKYLIITKNQLNITTKAQEILEQHKPQEFNVSVNEFHIKWG